MNTKKLFNSLDNAAKEKIGTQNEIKEERKPNITQPVIAKEIVKAPEGNIVHLDKFRQIMKSLSEEEVNIAIKEIIKDHPKEVFDELYNEFSIMKNTLTAISSSVSNL